MQEQDGRVAGVDVLRLELLRNESLILLASGTRSSKPCPHAAFRFPYYSAGGEVVDDRDLIERWRRGQPDAARTLVGQHYPRILNLFYRLTGTREEAEELTQDLFVRLTRHVAGNEQVEDLAAWLHRVGINLWRDWVRRTMTARQKGITTAGGDEEILRSQAPEEVEAAAMAHWERDVVRQAVLELSEAHREVIVLFYYQGCSCAEIAALTGMPVGTVRSRIHYATQRLYTRLGPNGEGGTEPWLNATTRR